MPRDRLPPPPQPHRSAHSHGPRWGGHRAVAWALALGLGGVLLAGAPLRAQTATATPPTVLPGPVRQALAKAQLPPEALAVVVVDANGASAPWLSHRAQAAVNPASTLKLVTTFAALDTLGPAHVWRTRVYTDGPLRDGTLEGRLVLQGGGDPALVSERLWLLLRRVQALGIQTIAGDIVLDRSAFALPPMDPGAFDGEPLRPYNASPDALLINHKAQRFTFTPDPDAGVARVGMEPPLAGVQAPTSVPLIGGPCHDWRAALGANFDAPLAPRFDGGLPASCGERDWSVAHPEPERFAARAVGGMWQALGGRLLGQVRDGAVPAGARLRFEHESPPLSEVVRDVNKFSNNVMAQHVLLALGQANGGDGRTDFETARRALGAWWLARVGPEHPTPVLDNGAGLSRDARVSAGGLARLLQLAYASGLMPELMASLPASGWDGTLRRSPLEKGLAHLKTGSLRDVQALAGYVHGPQGQRRVLVAIVNHPNAAAARPALQALVRWAAELPLAR